MNGPWGAVAAIAAFAAWCVAVHRPLRGSLPASGLASSRSPAASSLRFRSGPSPSVTRAGSLDAPLVLELVAAMLEAGSPLARALRIVARVSGGETGPVGRAAAALELGVAWDQAWAGEPDGQDGPGIRRALAFAAATGAPSSELISARARFLRRNRHRELERQAAALGVRLVVPLGACSLPAFLCLGVVPVLISMMPG